MKKNFLCLFVFYFSIAEAQHTFPQVIERYYKTSPYEKEFSTFLNQLFKDTTLQQDMFQRRSSALPFYFSGAYKKHMPFRYKAQEVTVTLADMIVDYTGLYDSTDIKDTILYYSISGITPPGPEYRQAVKKEFDWFHKRFGLRMSSSKYSFTGEKENITGEKYIYFFVTKMMAPLIITWNKLDDSEQYAFTVTVLIKVRNNQATLPDPFD